MDKSAYAGLRHCLRTRAPLRIRNSRTCASQNIRSYSLTIPKTCRALPQTRVSHPSASISHRFYSSESTSTIKGTVGAGAAGASAESKSAADILQAPDHLDEAEKKIWNILYNELSPTKLHVQDISGGCGSMYGIEVVSEKFRGLNILKQQRMVNKVLGEEIKGWHGVQLRTSAPS